MLSSVLRGGDLEDIGDAKEGLLGVPVGDHLEDGEVLQHAVHHVFFWKMLEFEYKVDHVFTHGTPLNFIQISSSFEPRTFGLHFFHNLFSKATYFGGTLNCHIFGTLIPGITHHFRKTTIKYFISSESVIKRF